MNVNIDFSVIGDPKLSDVAIQGHCYIIYEADYFGSEDGQDYSSDILKSPTWADVMAMAAQAKKRLGIPRRR